MCVEGTEDFNVRNTEGKSKVQKGSIEKKSMKMKQAEIKPGE